MRIIDAPKAQGLTAGVLIAPNSAPRSIVIALHGGEIAYDRRRSAAESLNLARAYATHLCPRRVAVFAVNYRWSTFGGAEMRDVAGAYDWLANRAPTTPIVLLGASHGGYMALLAASRRPWQRDWRTVIDLYGFVDLGRLIAGHHFDSSREVALTRGLLGEPSAANAASYHQLSPTVPQARIGGRLPTLIIVGSRDPFVAEDTAYARRLGRRQATLVVIRGAGHGIDTGASAATQQLWSVIVAYLAAHHLASAGS